MIATGRGTVNLKFAIQDKMTFIQHVYVIQQSTKFKQLRL